MQTTSDWNLNIEADGSGNIGVFLHYDSKASIPAGTFEFKTILRALQQTLTTKGDCTTHPTVAFFRKEKGSATHKPINDVKLVAELFNQAFNAAENPKGSYEELRQTIPLMKT